MSGSGLFQAQQAKIDHLVRGGGIGGEVADLRKDVKNTLAPLAAITVEEFTNPATADTNAFKTSIASSITAVDYSGAALNGVVGDDPMDYPRNVTVTCNDHAATWNGKSATFYGIDVNGRTISEDVALTNNATTAGVKCFKRVTRITIPALVDALGTIEFGFGVVLGLAKPITTRAGFTGPVREIAIGAVVTNGVFVSPSTAAPNGSYSPNTAPNGANDYALYYEYIPTY